MIFEKRYKKRVLILDSEEKQIRRIVNVVAKTAKELYMDVEIRAAKTILIADRMLKEEDVDILILDTVYRGDARGEYPGMDFVKKLRGSSKYEFLPVIFISSIPEPERMAYMQLNCLKFLPRGFHTKELDKSLKKALQNRTRTDEENYIVFRKQGIVYPVKIKNITYMEMKERQLYVHLADGNVLQIPHKTLAEIKSELAETCFIQGNRSTLVNKRYVKKIDLQEDLLVLNEEETIKIGKSYKDIVKWKFRKKTGVVRIKKTP